MSKPIRYYSTNRNLDHAGGIVPFNGEVSFRQALLMGQAPDEGLFMPYPLPLLSLRETLSLKDKPYAEAAMLVAEAFLAAEIDREV
ncbi:MAG: threonine synthase, partial [Syntrophales bacterium LBB04]|nr:threonine synthase [Syntrophales bacterium LBB04]